MIFMSLDSSQHDESNGGKIIFIRSVLIELRLKTHLIIIHFENRSTDWISMIFTSMDSSHRDESNGSKNISLRLILVELWLNKNFKYNFGRNYVNFGQNCGIGPCNPQLSAISQTAIIPQLLICGDILNCAYSEILTKFVTILL